MKLEEVFEKYSDDTLLRRKYSLSSIKCDVKWLKGLKAWGNEHRKLGFILPQYQIMIDDANADDWEIYDADR